ncbi:unnamed protein product [Effrenium voratum]|uniref:Uncharacterized protein n=1 Tax=Effrenium voratum TaxID=2562239 RepID=A0AA36HZ89_9DINO|nr:unnamed protein product [Effrenium voratum]
MDLLVWKLCVWIFDAVGIFQRLIGSFWLLAPRPGAQQRHHEERERVAHLNRAKDIQILREQPFNIVSQESKLEKLAPGKDPARLGGHAGILGQKERTKEGRGGFPGTAVDYDILSNMPFQEHHWAREDRRPHLKEKSPRVRKVPAFLCKDFDIVTNKYLDNHSEKLRQEKRVNLMEARPSQSSKACKDGASGVSTEAQKVYGCPLMGWVRGIDTGFAAACSVSLPGAWPQSEHSCSTPSADSAPELSAQLWSATLEYENLLNIQKEQHQLEVRRMEAESFRLRQAGLVESKQRCIELTGKAYLKAASADTVILGYKNLGITRFRPCNWCAWAFAALSLVLAFVVESYHSEMADQPGGLQGLTSLGKQLWALAQLFRQHNRSRRIEPDGRTISERGRCAIGPAGKVSFQDWTDSVITLCDSSMPGVYEVLEDIVQRQPKIALNIEQVVAWENRIVDYEIAPGSERISDSMKMAALVHMLSQLQSAYAKAAMEEYQRIEELSMDREVVRSWLRWTVEPRHQFVANRGHRIVLEAEDKVSYIEELATGDCGGHGVLRDDVPWDAVSPVKDIGAVGANEDEQPKPVEDDDGRSDLYQPSSREGEDAEPGIFELGEEQGDLPEEMLHEEFEEVGERLGQRSPIKPTADEVRQHNISHIPYRSWCGHCVRGKGRALQHQQNRASREEAGRARPRVSMDYFQLGKKSDDSALPLLAIIDEKSQRVFSVALPGKGVVHQYNTAIVVKLLKCLGLQDAVLKTDTERSLVALRSAAQLRLPGIGFEDAVKGADGFTPYERSTGKKWRIELPEFGECVWYQPLKGERDRSKLEAKFEPGIYLGIQEGTAMRWIGTAEGVVRTWTIKRKPEEEKWRADELSSFVGLPWQLRPRIDAQPDVRRALPDVRLEIDLPEVDDAGEPPMIEKKKKNYVPRGIYIRRDVELEAYGYTEGCDGCERARHGLSHKQHSRVCKERIMAEMSKSDEGKERVRRIKEREERYIVAVQESEERKKRSAEEQVECEKGKSAKSDDPGNVVDAVLGDVSGQVSEGAVRNEAALGGGLDSDMGTAAGGGGDDVVLMSDENSAGDDSAPAMQIGALHVMSRGQSTDFKEAVREASICETAMLLMEEDIEDRRLLLQVGAISVQDAYDLGQPIIAELFSPPRVSDEARRRGIGSGVALDLTTSDEYGNPWDFTIAEVRKRAADLIEEDLDLSTVPDEDWCTFVDEVSGKALEASKVQAARAEEIDYAQRYQVWTVVDTDECYKATGKPPISTRWIDLDKGDINRPNYRSRLVVQEVRSSEIEAIFAATPPLESIRMLLSLQRSGNERDHKGRRKKVMFLDVRRAHWTAKIFRLVYVQLPDEAGFCPGIGSPVLFCNQTRDLQVTLHGAVHSLQAGASLEGYVPAQLQMKEEEQRLLLEAKQKELELMSSLVRVRDQQIRELQRVVPKAREEPEARLVADLRRDKAQLEQQLLAKDRQLAAVQGLDPAMSDASALQLGAKAIQMFHDSMQMKQDSAILSRENEDLRKEVESLQLRVQELDGRVAEKRAEVKELTSTISGKMKRTLQLEEQVEALQRERHLALSGSQFQLHKVQEQLAAAQRESRAAQQLAADLKAEVAERDQRFVRQQAACTEHETCAQEMQQRVEELRGKLAKAEEAMRQLRQSGAFKDQLLRDMTEQVQASENKLHSFQMGELIAGSRPAGAFAPPAVEALEAATPPKSPRGAPGAKAAEELRSASQKSPRRMSSPDSGTMSGARLSSFPAISSVLLSESYRPHPGDPLDQQARATGAWGRGSTRPDTNTRRFDFRFLCATLPRKLPEEPHPTVRCVVRTSVSAPRAELALRGVALCDTRRKIRKAEHPLEDPIALLCVELLEGLDWAKCVAWSAVFGHSYRPMLT